MKNAATSIPASGNFISAAITFGIKDNSGTTARKIIKADKMRTKELLSPLVNTSSNYLIVNKF